MMTRQIIALCYVNFMKHIIIKSGKYVVVLKVKASGMHNYRYPVRKYKEVTNV
jgi:hypothetical protein